MVHRMTAKRALLVLLLAFGLPYTCSPVYRFPEPGPFSGTHFYNPYAGIVGTWQRANLHAHGAAWGGLTNGQQASHEVARAYRALGYDVTGVSNYHAIASLEGVETPPLYEHGYNISKRHQLAIGARRVEWLDFPFWQSRSQEQFIIDRVRATADLIGLTHPGVRGAYSDGDLAHLSGYQYIEVVNGPFESLAPWDIALSSGHAVWAMANDDSHDIGESRRMGMAWNMVDAPTGSIADLVPALRAGRTYAVGRRDDAPAGMDAGVIDVSVDDGTLRIAIDGEPCDIEFIGQQGVSKLRVDQVLRASYSIESTDTYIRTVIHTPRTTLYLNPVLRYDGQTLPAPMAGVDPGWTWALRIFEIAAFIAAGRWLWPRSTSMATTATSTSAAGSSHLERVDRESA